MPCSCNLAECGEVCDSVRALKLHDAVHSTTPSSSIRAPSSSTDTAATLEAPTLSEIREDPASEEAEMVKKPSTFKGTSTSKGAATSQQAGIAKHVTKSEQISPSEQPAHSRDSPTPKKASTSRVPPTVDQTAVERGGDIAKYFQDPHAKRPFIFLPIAARLAPAPLTGRQQGTSAEKATALGKPPQTAAAPTTASVPLDKASSSTSHGGAGYYQTNTVGPRDLYSVPTSARPTPSPLPARKQWTLEEAVVGGATLKPPAPRPRTFISIEEAEKMGVFGGMSVDPLQQVGQKSIKGEQRRTEAERKRKERMEATEERNKKRREEKERSKVEGTQEDEKTMRDELEDNEFEEADGNDIFEDDSDDDFFLKWDEDEEEYL